MRNVLLGLGVVMILLGVLWILQGMGVVGGGFMSGQSFWAMVGTVVLLVGGGLIAVGLRQRR